MSATQIATLHTSAGDIRIQLFGNHAPKTVKNFVGLADGTQEWTDPATGRVLHAYRSGDLGRRDANGNRKSVV